MITAALAGSLALSLPVNAAPVEIGFKMVKCKLFNSSRCARTTIRIDSSVYIPKRPQGADLSI